MPESKAIKKGTTLKLVLAFICVVVIYTRAKAVETAYSSRVHDAQKFQPSHIYAYKSSMLIC